MLVGSGVPYQLNLKIAAIKPADVQAELLAIHLKQVGAALQLFDS